MRRVLFSMVCWSVVIATGSRSVVADEPVSTSAVTTEVTTEVAAESKSEAAEVAVTNPEALDETKNERDQPIAQKNSDLPVIEPVDSKTAAEFVAQERFKDAHGRGPGRGPDDADRGPQGRNSDRRPDGPGRRHRDDHRPSGSEHRNGEHGTQSGSQRGPGGFGPHHGFGPSRGFADRRPSAGGQRRPPLRQHGFGRGQQFGRRGFGPRGPGFGPQFGHGRPRGGFGPHQFGPHQFGTGPFGQRGFGPPFMPARGHEVHRPQFHRPQFHSSRFHRPSGNPPMGPAPFNQAVSPERVFESLDANKDGMISKDEFLKRHAPSGARPDAHRDEPKRHEGGPTGPGRSESVRPGFGRPGFGPSGQGPGMSGPPSVEMIFGRLDRNHDGKVSQDEAPEFLWERLSGADTNKDGVVSKEEMEQHHQQMRGGQKPDGRDQRPVEERPKRPSA